MHNSISHCTAEFNVESGVRMEFVLVFVRSVASFGRSVVSYISYA